MTSKFPIGNVIFFLINYVHAHNFLKEWRMEILGKLKSKAIGLMNKAEVKWYERKSFGEQYILCDQLTMAVLIRPKVAAKTILLQVRDKIMYSRLPISSIGLISSPGWQNKTT